MPTKLVLGILPQASFTNTWALLRDIEANTSFKLTLASTPTSSFQALVLRSKALFTATFETPATKGVSSFAQTLQQALPQLLVKNPQVAACELSPLVGKPILAVRNEERSTYPRPLTINPLFTAFGPADQALESSREPALTTIGIAASLDLRLHEVFMLMASMAELGFAPLVRTNTYVDNTLFRKAGLLPSKAERFSPIIFRTADETERDAQATTATLATILNATPAAQAAYLFNAAPQKLHLVRKTTPPKPC